ncbi:Signal transduction histidine kinase [Promicromonospora umidemergens]|uniref:ATP-binding protein n=1 Tax=Promicromonospora umidemergens TaxID=629679 RepID=UPI0020A5BAB3|nr:ATP-binding protein [Promicromonospora umidemergens]MCP2286463.1 Signal transduction histidine kinase [Promicromonospora umidemergens]
MSSSPPPSRLRQVAPWVCVAGVLAYVLVAPVLFTATGASSTWPAWLVGIAAVGLAVAAALIAARSSRDDLASHQVLVLAQRRAEERAEAASAALDALAKEQLPAFLHSEPAPPLPHLPGDADAQARLDAAAAMLARVQEERVARRDAVQVAVVALSRKVQAAAHRIQEEAARMVQRHPTDPDILQTSMRVDHAAAQQARQAQSLAALCGEWPGQQWSEPLPLPDVVKGAASRITAFHRVEVSGDPGVAVSARIVEPLIHLVAELLSNATQSSPPTTQVLVSLRQVQRGAVVEIDDCGVGLDLKQLEQARDIASGKREISITELGEIPQTGLAVVGTYARRHGFRVDVTESVYGGLRAIVMIPAELTEAVVPTGMLTPAATLPSAGSSSAGVSALGSGRSASATAVIEPQLAPELPGARPADDGEWPAPAAPDPASVVPVEPLSVPGDVVDDEEETPVAGAQVKAPGELPLRPGRARPEDDEFPEPSALPQRRSRRGEAEAPDDRTRTAEVRTEAPGPAQSAEEAGEWMGAFFSSSEARFGDSSDSSEPPAGAGGTSEDR